MKISIVFNLSASGGTVCSAILSATDKIAILNEYHPLKVPKGEFIPGDGVGNLLQSGINISNERILKIQRKVLKKIVFPEVRRNAKNLLIRWHSHSDFLATDLKLNQIDLTQTFLGTLSYRGICIIRDPLSTFISNFTEGFITFGFKEFLQRYGLFIEYQNGIEVHHYESLMLNSDLFKEISIRHFNSWQNNQLDPINWKNISGTRKNYKSGIREPNVFSLVDAERILPTIVYQEIKDNLGGLDDLNNRVGYTDESYGELRGRAKLY